VASIKVKDLNDETALYTDTSFEIIVNEEGPIPARRIRDYVIRVSDNESTIRWGYAAFNQRLTLFFST